MKIKRYKDFILENNNLKKSIASMDKFGMTDFTRLPLELEHILKSKGFDKEESNFIKKYDTTLIEFYLDNSNGEDDYITVSLNNKNGLFFSIGSVERINYSKMIKFADNIDNIAQEFLEISNIIERKERKEKFQYIFKKYGIEENYIAEGGIVSNENLDNVKKSEKGLNKFGMSNYGELPESLKNKSLKLGYNNINYGGYDHVIEKSIFSKQLENLKDISFDSLTLSIFISEDSENKVSSNSLIYYLIDFIGDIDFSISIGRKRYNYEDIDKILDSNIEDVLYDYIKNDKIHERQDLIDMINSIGVEFKDEDSTYFF